MKWAKLLRRGTAFFLAIMAVWCLVSAWAAGAAEGQGLALEPSPQAEVQGAEMGFWEGLIVGQSPFLRRGQVLVAQEVTSESTLQSVEAEEKPPAATASPQPEDDTPLPQSADPSQKVIAQTLLPATDGSYPSADGVFLFNRTNQAVDMEALAQSPIALTGQGKGPQILIVHTHATEAYTQSGQDLYTESDPYRTTDDGHNVVRVGDEMAAAFAQAGLNVLHDRTLHDHPNYNGAYTRSRQTVEEYLAAYPSISIVLDVHRDALEGDDGSVYKAVADSGVLPECAQVMLVVGTQEGGGSHPEWRQNLTLAMALERALNSEAATLARPIVLRKSHYNQQLSPGSLLVEVGTHGNTLQEAITAARAFAQISAPVLKELLAQ